MDLIFGSDADELSLPVPHFEPAQISWDVDPALPSKKNAPPVLITGKDSFLRVIDFHANEMTDDALAEVRWQKTLEKWYKVFLISTDARPGGLVIHEDDVPGNLERIREILGTRSCATAAKG